jgi:hypothetical protein
MGVGGMISIFYLHRLTPIHDWQVMADGTQTVGYLMGRPTEGEIMELPGCHWYSQAIAERDRANCLVAGEQGSLEL